MVLGDKYRGVNSQVGEGGLYNLLRSKRMQIITLLLVLMSLLLGCMKEDAPMEEKYAHTFRLAESHPDNHPTTLADYEFARLVEEKTDGRIKIIVYNNQELGEEEEMIKQLKFGAIDFARVSSGPMAEYVPALNMIQLPYLYEDGDHMWRVLQSDLGRSFLSSVSEAGFVGLGWMDAGARSFYNDDGPIESVEDLQGMHLRVMNSHMMLDMVEALGGMATTLPYGEVYGALQTGEIDGAENNWPSYDTSSHYEVAGYFSVDEHIRVPELLLGSAKALENLSEADMAILHEAALETEAYQRELWQAEEKASQDKLVGYGVKVNVIEDRSAFREAMTPVYEKYASDYLETIKEIQEKY